MHEQAPEARALPVAAIDSPCCLQSKWHPSGRALHAILTSGFWTHGHENASHTLKSPKLSLMSAAVVCAFANVLGKEESNLRKTGNCVTWKKSVWMRWPAEWDILHDHEGQRERGRERDREREGERGQERGEREQREREERGEGREEWVKTEIRPKALNCRCQISGHWLTVASSYVFLFLFCSGKLIECCRTQWLEFVHWLMYRLCPFARPKQLLKRLLASATLQWLPITRKIQVSERCGRT